MSNTFLAPPRRRPQIVAVAAAVLVATLVIVALGRNGPRPSTPDSRPVVGSQPAQTPATDASQPAIAQQNVVDGGLIVLIRGARLVNGISVGYPHTEIGAVSAAVEYLSQACSTLDSDRAAAIGRLVGDGAPGASPDDFAQGPVNTRRYLGLPLSGPLPANASVVLGPVAFQLRDTTADRSLVLLLGYLTTSSPQKGMLSRLGVFPVRMVWQDEDWKITRLADTTDYRPLTTQPGSLHATDLGWREMTR